MGLDAGLRRGPGRLRCQQFGHIGLGPGGLAGIVQVGRLPDHQRRRLGLDVRPGNGKLHPLVGTYGSAKHLPLAGVGGRFRGKPARIADALGGDQDTLGIHAIEDTVETLPFAADKVGDRHPQIINKELRGGVVHHGVYRPDGQPVAERLAHIHQQHRHAVRGATAIGARGRAHQQHHQVGMFRAGDKYFLAVHHEIIPVAHGRGANAGGIGATGGLGYTEGLQPQPAGGDIRQKALFLFIAAVSQQGAHGVHLGVAGAAVAATAVNFFQHRAGGPERQAAATVFLGDQYRQIARRGQRPDKLCGVVPPGVQRAPVAPPVAGAQSRHRRANIREVQLDSHGFAYRNQEPPSTM